MKKFRIKSLPKAQEGVTTQDSLDVYNNALQLKTFYDQYKPYYSDIKFSPFTETYEGYTIDQIQDQHLTSPHITSANKAKIRNEKNPDVYHISDMVTPQMDPKAPLARFDRRIKPQGLIQYIPKTYYENAPASTEKLMDHLFYKEPGFSFTDFTAYPFDKKYDPEAAKKTRSALEGYARKMGVPTSTVDDILWRQLQADKLKDILPGNYTTIPYYDPIMVKPWHMLTEKEKDYRRSYAGTSSKPKGTTDPKKSVVVNLIKSGLAKDTASAKKVRSELMQQVFGEKATGSAAQNTKLNKWLFDNPDAMTAYKETGNISITESEPTVNTFSEAVSSLPLKPVQRIVTERAPMRESTNIPAKKLVTDGQQSEERASRNDYVTKRYNKKTDKWIEDTKGRGAREAQYDKERWKWAEQNKKEDGSIETDLSVRYRFQNGGESIELELTPEQIQWYLDNGYNVDYM